MYVPDDMMVDASERREFSRAPVAIAMFACELCSFETDVKEELQLHWREEHFAKSEGQDVGMDVSRCEEEYRKRMTFLHQTTGRRAAVCKLFLFCLSDGWKWDVRNQFLFERQMVNLQIVDVFQVLTQCEVSKLSGRWVPTRFIKRIL